MVEVPIYKPINQYIPDILPQMRKSFSLGQLQCREWGGGWARYSMTIVPFHVKRIKNVIHNFFVKYLHTIYFHKA